LFVFFFFLGFFFFGWGGEKRRQNGMKPGGFVSAVYLICGSDARVRALMAQPSRIVDVAAFSGGGRGKKKGKKKKKKTGCGASGYPERILSLDFLALEELGHGLTRVSARPIHPVGPRPSRPWPDGERGSGGQSPSLPFSN